MFVTQHDYPHNAPKAFHAPFIGGLDLMDPVATFQQLWEVATPIDNPPDWEWSNDKYLIDYVIAIEVDMGLRQPTTVTIPVFVDEDGEALCGESDVSPADGVLKSDTEVAESDNSGEGERLPTDEHEEEAR